MTTSHDAFRPIADIRQLATLSVQMALEPLWTGSELLRKLVSDFLSGGLRTETFCRDVELAYNDAIDDSALTAAEQPIFENLFNEVVWFSPFPEERARIPNYRDEEQVRRAALVAQAGLEGLS